MLLISIAAAIHHKMQRQPCAGDQRIPSAEAGKEPNHAELLSDEVFIRINSSGAHSPISSEETLMKQGPYPGANPS